MLVRRDVGGGECGKKGGSLVRRGGGLVRRGEGVYKGFIWFLNISLYLKFGYHFEPEQVSMEARSVVTVD